MYQIWSLIALISAIFFKLPYAYGGSTGGGEDYMRVRFELSLEELRRT